MKAKGRTFGCSSAPRISTSAASTPSSEVPAMRPTASRLRSRPRVDLELSGIPVSLRDPLLGELCKLMLEPREIALGWCSSGRREFLLRDPEPPEGFFDAIAR